jgi:N-acetylmuramoyl-L-alanine amidase
MLSCDERVDLMTIKTSVLIVAGLLLAGASPAAAQPVRDLYDRAQVRERTVREAASPTLQQLRSAVSAYERIVLRYPASSYCDNALWQGGNLALLAYERFGKPADKQTAVRMLKLLTSDYSSSPFLRRARTLIADVERETTAARTEAVPAPPKPTAQKIVETPKDEPQRGNVAAPAIIEASDLPAPVVTKTGPTTLMSTLADTTPASSAATSAITIRNITRTALEDGVRISIEMDRELTFRHEELANPKRIFFDLKGALPTQSLLDATMKFSDDVVREIRLGRHPKNTTRVVLDTEGVDSYSVFTLYEPFRVIVDFKRSSAVAAGSSARAVTPGAAPMAVSTSGPSTPEPKAVASTVEPPAEAVIPSRSLATPDLPAPSVPSANSNGQFSLARQLGLSVSRIVIDAGHGGHDPGARGNGLNEADLTLDVALRLKKLLEKQPGVEVVMTREKNIYIPLEERTAIANREAADLFLSIHANASRNINARGVETYFLNFASNPEAEAVAARENSASGKSMHNLPDIVRAIALNNKIDESRDFATTVQKSMVSKLSIRNRQVRDLGVKQAPFVVLIGAGMPSVLAEISFLTNKQEGQLLKTSAYRQSIADGLLEAILRYQRSLKRKTAIAAREEN